MKYIYLGYLFIHKPSLETAVVNEHSLISLELPTYF